MEQYASRSVANFGAKIFKEADSGQSTVCSPLSAELVVAILALGCKDKSNAEILRALEIPDDDALLSSFAHLTSTLKSIRGATLNVANKIYVKKCAEIKPGVKKDVEEVFDSSVEQIDFSMQEAAAKTINNWLSQQTNSNTTLTTTLDVGTRLVVVNTIYFQGVWEKPFDTRLNTNCLFHTPHNFTVTVTLMRIPRTSFNYGVSEELKARLLQLKFEGGDASMVIVLPDEGDGLKSVLEMLESGHDIMDDIENLKNTELDVMMPIFDGRITTQLNFISHLVKLGITSIFDERKSQVDMFTANDNLYGSNAGQRTSIKVDDREIPTTADCSMPKVEDINTDPCIESFIANRPFLYMIIVRGLPIFMGSFKGRHQDILNYSCNHLSNSFSLSVCTFYSRYDNTREQERLNRILENYATRVASDAEVENTRNRNIENPRPGHRYYNTDEFDLNEYMCFRALPRRRRR